MTQKRDQTIDLLRGISICLVLLLHFHLAYRIDQGFFASLLPAQWLKDLARNGNYGVTIFFVISGYLITTTSLRRFKELRHFSLKQFYLFRFARIVPNITLMVALVLLFGFLGIRIFQNHPGSVTIGATL